MGFFSFIENFFFISLGIVFILVLLLVYHFKQRMSSVERKGDTMYEIMTNMLKEIRFMKGFYSDSNTSIPDSVQTKEVEPDRITYSIYDPSSNVGPSNVGPSKGDTEKPKIVVSDDDDSSEDEFDTESDSEDSDSDNEDDGEDDIDLHADVIEMDPPTTVNCESPSTSTLEEVVINEASVETSVSAVESTSVETSVSAVESTSVESTSVESTSVSAVEPTVVEPTVEESLKKLSTEELKKMNIHQLKAYALSSGISVDTSKMKKHELITLLQST